MKPVSGMTVKAYAKLNFVLNIKGKREDGYHELSGFMQSADLFDDVLVEWEEGGEGLSVELSCDDPAVPRGQENLAYKAAVLMHEEFHKDKNEKIKISITKRIPMGAGLAGGSADGAAVLSALARLWCVGTVENILKLGAELGSDVPFCVLSQNGCPSAVAAGRGEKLVPVPPAPCRVIIRTPGVPSETAKVYAELRPEDYAQQLDLPHFLAERDIEGKCAFMGNHLEAPAFRLHPEIEALEDEMAEDGDALAVMMSGSGSAVFAVYEPDCEKEGAVLSPPGRK